ncbi:MAG: bifunctional DNA-formamidopyrimidine glycosylase/DNA-(apurinic or apyrimidinic site) lyase [Burkholderiaceae bacterium]
MPELPEVEVVRRGVEAAATGRRVAGVVVRAPRLRWPIPQGLDALLRGRVLLSAQRRSKYLLLHFEPGVLIIHLGMSGTFTWLSADTPVRRHDHFDLLLDGGVLRLNDPRRFGAVLWSPAQGPPLQDHVLLRNLGVEPFSPEFDGARLYQATRGRRGSIKALLLAGTVVVGVGNIYASESLHRAGIRPGLAAGRLSRPRCDRLADAVRATLADAIAAGGSSLRDFVSSEGQSGHFQLECLVYGRAGQPCRRCGVPIRRRVQQQRASYWCPACQR